METPDTINAASPANPAETESIATEKQTLAAIEFQNDAPAHIQDIRDAVYRLLKYAVSDANRDVDTEIINKTVPILQKNPQQLMVEDEKTLWIVYNQLSRLVTPATNESLWLKEQIEQDDRAQAEGNSGDYSFTAKAYKKIYASIQLIGATCCLIFFLLQGYTVALSDSLEQVTAYYVELTKVEEQILATKQAKPDIELCTSPLNQLNKQRDQLLFKIDGHYQVIEKLSRFFWGYLYSTKTLGYYQKRSPACLDKETTIIPYRNALEPDEQDEQHARAERVAFFEGAKSMLRICNYLMLPFILGTLGSVAYVIRSILDSFAQASLTIGSNRSGSIRVYLGGVLGLISGVIIVPDIKEIRQVNYTPLVWAFLMGYSVEFAFTFFDALIARGRNALQAIKAPAPPTKEANPEIKPPKNPGST